MPHKNLAVYRYKNFLPTQHINLSLSRQRMYGGKFVCVWLFERNVCKRI